MRKVASLLTVGACAALVFAALSSARPAAAHYRFTATLNAGQEVPKQAVKNQA